MMKDKFEFDGCGTSVIIVVGLLAICIGAGLQFGSYIGCYIFGGYLFLGGLLFHYLEERKKKENKEQDKENKD